ncbi:pregnancy zone protein-like [Lutra lutra]|uniref:pregnancy zone protein-like n=1 Tax=Lutra lutra TaxID=9657 RepID=UPI001FD2EC36|nr:pregnancy zone protein-like [Lutra lutra]
MLPYSVIHGEAFTLKTTVLNYLPKCIRVSVELKVSPAFLQSQNEKREESYHICANERQTLFWMMTPKTLGNVNFSVSAEAVQSPELRGNEIAEVPEIRRKDTVVKTLLVEVRVHLQRIALAIQALQQLERLTSLYQKWSYSRQKISTI